MLICDLCGGKDKVEPRTLEFQIKKHNEIPIGTLYSQDVCKICYIKICDMIDGGTIDLSGVLSKGLDLQQKVFRQEISPIDEIIKFSAEQYYKK